jgi:uracil-DNA glycosylase
MVQGYELHHQPRGEIEMSLSSAKIILIGEAWGVDEQRHKHAFVGAAGRELAAQIAHSNLAPAITTKYPSCEELISYWQNLSTNHGIHLLNVFNLHPENNKIDLFFSRDGNRSLAPYRVGKYLIPEYMPHVLRLWENIRSLNPNLIITLGGVASWAVLGKTIKISEIRGTINPARTELHNLKTLPTYHPSYIMQYGYSDRPIVIADLIKAKSESQFPEIRRTERFITIPNPDSVQEIISWIQRPADMYAVDIETGYALYTHIELTSMLPRHRFYLSSQISMIGFARSKSDALVIPFMARNADNTSLDFWSTPELETQAWRLTRELLQSPIPKIFQNGMFDIQRLLEKGLVPRNCLHDTMLRQHALYPELQKSLGFLVSIHCNEFPWKGMYSNRDHLKRDE